MERCTEKPTQKHILSIMQLLSIHNCYQRHSGRLVFNKISRKPCTYIRSTTTVEESCCC